MNTAREGLAHLRHHSGSLASFSPDRLQPGLQRLYHLSPMHMDLRTLTDAEQREYQALWELSKNRTFKTVPNPLIADFETLHTLTPPHLIGMHLKCGLNTLGLGALVYMAALMLQVPDLERFDVAFAGVMLLMYALAWAGESAPYQRAAKMLQATMTPLGLRWKPL